MDNLVTNKMRIAIIQGAFLPIPPLLGGAVEKMWYSLGKEFVRRGHEVTHISRTYEGLPTSEVIDGVRHLRVQGHNTPKSGLILKALDLLYSLRVRKVLTSDFDVVVTNTFWAPIVLPKKYQQICMVDVQRMPKKQTPLYYRAVRLRANSNPVADAIRSELPPSQHHKVVLIPNLLPFTPSHDIDLTTKKPVILYAGRIHPEKGLDILINAYKQTSQAYQLKIVGPWEIAAGGGGANYLKSLRQLAGDASVEFVEPLFDIQALNKLYMDASLFVYPSVAEKGETFGLAPLEAMAWGCVPIVSNLACFHDFIRDGENGLIFDHRSPNAINQLAQRIANLQQNHELRMQLAKSALDVRQSHSASTIADLFLGEFERISSETNKKISDRSTATYSE